MLVMSLNNYYVESYALVTNNGQISNMFKTSIWVKQGGPLSPRLFAEYVEFNPKKTMYMGFLLPIKVKEKVENKKNKNIKII